MSDNDFSSVCLTKFPYAKDGSLPPAGQPITEEYGISALSMLFLNLTGESPKMADDAKYKRFLGNFKSFFERYQEEDVVEAVPTKLNDITEKFQGDLCQGHTGERIKVDNSTRYNLQRITQQLVDRQKEHVNNSMRILFKLFDERAVRSRQFAMSEYVKAEGMAAVNKIAEEAGAMLMEYYGDCEKTYKDGVFVLYNQDKKEELTRMT